MDTYKLYNTIRNDFLDNKKRIKELKFHKFSYKLLNEFFSNYVLIEATEHSYCCYGEDKCCWIEVPSSWLRSSGVTEKKLNSTLYENFKNYMKHGVFAGNNDLIYKRKILICELKNNSVCICVPLRDKCKTDYYFIFDKTKTLVGSE